ncbi:MAG: tetratricopeptide repeat protein, partial [Gammaproteobacteria bacterium]|nr:tetratricopeptide repeat protein [Gammaproteobacteria bacterium]
MPVQGSSAASFLQKLDLALTANSRWLPVLFISSFLLKLVYVIQSSEALYVTVPIMDSEYYYNMAMDILKGEYIRGDAFFMGPLYPYVLALVFGVFGKSIMILRIIQILGGSLVVVLTYVMGRRVFRPSVALLASVMLALYGTITFYEGQLLMMWLGTLLNMTMLYVLYRMRDKPGPRKYVLVGILLGLSALARANILMFLVVLFVWIIIDEKKKRWRCVSVLAATVVMTILPATVHNYVASRDLVAITANGGVNFYIGNSEEATGIFYPPKGINLVTDDAVKKHVERLLGRELSASELSRYWYQEAFDFIRNNPRQALILLLKKTALYFNAYEVPQIESYQMARERFGTLRMLFVNFWMLVVLGSMGMLYLIRDWRKHFLLYGYILSFSLSIILFFVTSRYRVQIAPVLCLFAAHALLCVLPSVVANLRRQLLPVVAVIIIVVATRPSLFALPGEDVRWRELTHEARRWSTLGNHVKAIETIDQAINIHPGYPDSYIQRAIIYKEGGNLFKAIESFSRALDINPDIATVQYDYGQALRQVRMYEPAVEAYRAAIRLNPRMLEAYNNLGITYVELGDYENAIKYFAKVIEM